MTVNEFVKWIYPQAKTMGEIDPVFVTAQAALESGWGKAAIGNNLFGITKGSRWNGAVQLVATTEYFKTPDKAFAAPETVINVTPLPGGVYKYAVKRLFRDYSTVADCLKDHLDILQNPGYADAWPYRDRARLYVQKIQDDTGSKYATSANYVATMNKLFVMVEKAVKEEGL